MGYLASIFRYIRLKSTISVLRFLVWWNAGWPKAFPDSVLQIPSRDTRRTIKAHVYQSSTSNQPRPVLLNFHGSGFVLPQHGSDDAFCRLISNETEYAVLDIQYRLAPENPWPASVNDAEDVVNWVLKQPDRFDLSNISISGFSAGANLSLVQAGVIFPQDTFRSLICFYPPTDLSIDPGLKVAKIPDPSGKPIPSALAKLFDSCYIPPGWNVRDPRISPAFAPTEKYPQNVLMITCACDTLCLEAEAVAAKIEESSRERNVVSRRMEKCDHGWDKRTKKGSFQEKAKDEAYDLAVQMLRL